VVLLRESLLVEKEQQILVKYTLLESPIQIGLRLRPFLAFRNHHSLSRSNLYANTKVRRINQGVMSRLYEGYPGLYMQLSKDNEFVHVPDWYYNIEYMREMERGYDYKEDLFVPGYFELCMRKGESLVFSAGTREASPQALKRKYTNELSRRIPRTSFYNCLANSAQQFIVRKERKTEIMAGFPWFGTWGRDTFVALPGLTLPLGDRSAFIAVADTMVKKLKDGLFPNMGSDVNPAYNSVDAPLFFIWALQQYNPEDPGFGLWKKYGRAIKNILNAFRSGTRHGIRMQEDGLISAGEHGVALTWMDAVVNGEPVTPRTGLQVEINALWYNALVFSLELAEDAGDTRFVSQWQELPGVVGESFIRVFWDNEKQYLADFVKDGVRDVSVRPNQVIAASMLHTPMSKEMIKSVLDVAENELLTPRGLRTLSPKNPQYRGVYRGSQEERDCAYHQGTAWPWLLQHFCEAYLRIHRHSGPAFVRKLYEAFEEEMGMHGIGSVSEIYDGDPPHEAKGAISQAWSVGALLRIHDMLQKTEKNSTE
jgi:predicted glycogen debranching enzyme